MTDLNFVWEDVDFRYAVSTVGAGNLVFYSSVDQVTSGIDVELDVRADGTYVIREPA